MVGKYNCKVYIYKVNIFDNHLHLVFKRLNEGFATWTEYLGANFSNPSWKDVYFIFSI